MTANIDPHDNLLAMIRDLLEKRRDELQNEIRAYPGDGNSDREYARLVEQRGRVARQLNEVDAIARIAGDNVLFYREGLAKFIIGLTTLSDEDRLAIADRVTRE